MKPMPYDDYNAKLAADVNRRAKVHTAFSVAVAVACGVLLACALLHFFEPCTRGLC